MDATGDLVSAVDDTFVVHMDREALGDLDMGECDVTVRIRTYVPAEEIAWTILGRIRPQIGHIYGYRLTPAEPAEDGTPRTVVTSYYDWSDAAPEWKSVFPIISEQHLKATLGILACTVARRGRV